MSIPRPKTIPPAADDCLFCLAKSLRFRPPNQGFCIFREMRGIKPLSWARGSRRTGFVFQRASALGAMAPMQHRRDHRVVERRWTAGVVDRGSVTVDPSVGREGGGHLCQEPSILLPTLGR